MPLAFLRPRAHKPGAVSNRYALKNERYATCQRLAQALSRQGWMGAATASRLVATVARALLLDYACESPYTHSTVATCILAHPSVCVHDAEMLTIHARVMCAQDAAAELICRRVLAARRNEMLLHDRACCDGAACFLFALDATQRPRMRSFMPISDLSRHRQQRLYYVSWPSGLLCALVVCLARNGGHCYTA